MTKTKPSPSPSAAPVDEQAQLAEQLALASQLGDDQYDIESDPTAQTLETLGKGGIKALDYLGGAVRGLGAGAIAGSKMSPEYREKLKQAAMFKDRWPSGQAAMREAGMLKPGEEGDLLSAPGLMGLATEVVTDPLTWVSMLGRGAKAAEGLSPRAFRRTPGVDPIPPTSPEATGGLAGARETAERAMGRQGLPGPAEQLLLGESDIRAIKDVPNTVVPGTPKEAAESLLKKFNKAAVGATKAPSAVMNWLGETVYGQAFPTMRMQIPKAHRKDVVKQLQKAGIWGGPVKRVDDVTRALEESGSRIGSLLDEGTRRGGKIDLRTSVEAMKSQAEEYVRKGLLSRDEADEFMTALVGDYARTTLTPDLALASQWKTQVQRQLPEGAWTVMAKKNRQEEFNQLRKTFQGQLNKDIVAEAGRVLGPGGQKQLLEASHLYGSVADATKSIWAGAKKESGTSTIKPMDWLIASGEVINPNAMSADLLMLKKGFEVGMSPTVLTTMGTAISNTAKNPVLGTLIDNLTRSIVLNQGQPDQGEDFYPPLQGD